MVDRKSDDRNDHEVVEYLTGLKPGVLRRRTGTGGRRIADLVFVGDADPRVVVDQLIDDVDLAGRLSSVAHRLNSTSAQAIDVLETLALSTPVGVLDPAAGLTEVEESILREAGSLTVAMPPIDQRASTFALTLTHRLMVDAVSVRDAATLLGVSDSRVRQRLSEGSLVGILSGNTWSLPRFQFPNGSELPGLAEVLRAFPRDIHPLAVALFLERAQPDLEIYGSSVSPAFWLFTGGAVSAVVDLAIAAYEYQ